jgi:hypothetical protein
LALSAPDIGLDSRLITVADIYEPSRPIGRTAPG